MKIETNYFAVAFVVTILLLLVFEIVNACLGEFKYKGSNRELGADNKNTFRVAYVKVGPDYRKVSVASWRDWDDGDVVQVTDKRGVVYLTNYSNVVLLSEDK